MTLVTTLHGRDGVVMFTDTQETVGGYAKKIVDKLTLWNVDGPFRFAIAAATNDTTYLEMLEREISRALFSVKSYALGEIERSLVDALTGFYAKHIWPQPSKNHLIEFLITLQPMPNGRPDVIHISGTAVSVPTISENHKSIGVGAYMADYLLPIFLGGGEDLAQLAMTAVYVGKEVHDNVDGVGPVDRIILLGNNGDYHELYHDVIRELEENLFPFRDVIQQAFRAASEVLDEGKGDLEHNYIGAELRDMREKNTELWNRMQQQIKAHAQWREKFGNPKAGQQ